MQLVFNKKETLKFLYRENRNCDLRFFEVGYFFATFLYPRHDGIIRWDSNLFDAFCDRTIDTIYLTNTDTKLVMKYEVKCMNSEGVVLKLLV